MEKEAQALAGPAEAAEAAEAGALAIQDMMGISVLVERVLVVSTMLEQVVMVAVEMQIKNALQQPQAEMVLMPLEEPQELKGQETKAVAVEEQMEREAMAELEVSTIVVAEAEAAEAAEAMELAAEAAVVAGTVMELRSVATEERAVPV